MVEVARLVLDRNMVHGQIRRLDDVHVAERVTSLVTAPPLDLISVVLKAADPAGMHLWFNFCPRTRTNFISFTGLHYWVLSGQHSVAALQRLREVRQQERLQVNLPWLETVRAIKILKCQTPTSAAQLFAGEHQASQGDTNPLRAGQFLKLLSLSDEDAPILLGNPFFNAFLHIAGADPGQVVSNRQVLVRWWGSGVD